MSREPHLSSPASAHFRARGKGTQVFEHHGCFSTWVPFPSLRSAGDDSFYLEVAR
jgi:hypothetical protein